MTKDEKRILADLNKRVQQKLVYCLSDHFTACDAVDLDLREVTRDMMVMLVHLTASFGASRFNITPQDFARAMALQFIEAQKKEREDEDSSL